MCGINGITRNDRVLIESMNAVTQHRGPDGSHVFEAPGITLGHNRLSIIDLRSVADQPFVSDDKRYVIVYNGELYNFKELRHELSDFSYRTESDTEVLLNAYRKWGSACVPRFNGIFAFAIWDTETQTLFLARDQFGVKPLYYALHDDTLIFSSEVKALLESGIEPMLNMAAFPHYMRLLYTPGSETLFKGITRLLPGHTLTYQKGVTTIAQYYTIPDATADFSASYTAQKDTLRAHLDTAVERQLVADVPVGVYLSGGIDSTVIVDSVSRLRGGVDTFSIGYALEEGEEVDKFNADYHLAARTAKHYGTKHHGYMLESTDILSLIHEHVWHMDEPVGNLTALAQKKLAEYAKHDVRVVLGGDGGDELFGGYKRHGLARRLLPFWRLPASLRSCAPRALAKVNQDTWAGRYLFFLAQKDVVLDRILTTVPGMETENYFGQNYFAETTHTTFLDDMMHADMGSWLVDESFLRSDKMSMASGLEQRVPFLDPDLVHYARTIPDAYKTTFFETKKILKDAFRDRLPHYVLHQPKRGWISPGAKWIRRPEVRTLVESVLSPTYHTETAHLFNWNEIVRMYEDHVARRAYHLTPLWSIIVFQVWAKRFNIRVER